MNYFTTSALIAAGFVAATSANAALTVGADYDFSTFADGTGDLTTAGFNINGDAAISGGQLILDGTGDYLTIADPLGGATDNFAIEATFTADTAGTFNFVATRNTGTTNSGGGILIQSGNFNALASLVGFQVSTPQTLGSEVTVNFVRQDGTYTLYVNGVNVGSNAATWNGTPDTAGIGAHNFDAPDGLLDGSIARVRYSTFAADDPLGIGGDGFIEVIPEPSSLALIGLGGLMLVRRRCS